MAHIFARAVIDLGVSPFDDADRYDQAAADGELTAGHQAAFEIELLPPSRSQQLTAAAVFYITGPRPVVGQLNIPAVGSQFVKLDINIEIFLVRDEVQSTGKQA